MRMRMLPASLIFFVATGVVYLLQMIPLTGIFLMFALAMFWSVVLVNLGMIGIGFEALAGRVSRLWLIVPISFYAGYWAWAAADQAKLAELTATYAAANAAVRIPFDPSRHALVFENDGSSSGSGEWLTQNYGLPVSYSARVKSNDVRSHRMMDQSICAKVRENPALRAAQVHAFGFHDGEGLGGRKRASLCMVSMPEKPELPVVRVVRREEKAIEGGLPIVRVTTTVTMPDGRSYRLLGGTASPLSAFPMPVAGCALNSGAPAWECMAAFYRNGFTPILTGTTRYNRDGEALARALGLKRVPPEKRQSGDPSQVGAKIDAAEAEALARQLANVDAMIADPLAKVEDWQVGVIANRPEVLDARADAIMTGVERAAAAAVGNDRYKASESGRILAGLIAGLPRERFQGFGPRILAIYSRADDEHWLWKAETLIRRLGDLGAGALPYLVRPRASVPNVNGAGIEGLCRVGPPAKDAGGPVLTAMWQKTRDFDRDERRALFVAMRRIGVPVPPLAEDKRGQVAKLQEEWGDISPASPPRVCAVRQEAQARSEEKHSGKRRTNLE